MGSIDELIRLTDAGTIDIGPEWRRLPAVTPLRDLDFSRVEGMLLGIAIGDSLGNTTESQPPHRRRERWGEIREYLPNRYAGGRRVGVPSDDSQMSFWTLEHLLEHGSLEPAALAGLFASRHIYGIGGTVRDALAGLREGLPWDSCGVAGGAGNGALMRIAPFVLPHVKVGGKALWADAAIATVVTHNSSAAIGTSIAFVDLLWQLLSLKAPPRPDWWVSSFVERLRAAESDSVYAPRFGAYRGRPPARLSAYTESVIADAVRRNLSVIEACESWGSGAYLMETVPSVLYILMRLGDDPAEAIVRAVNDTKDNDTIASIVGAAVGALHGRNALPAAWVDGLLGRTEAEDDGRVFELMERARAYLS